MKFDSNSVALFRCNEYQPRLLLENIDRLWEACDRPFNPCSARVLLKPNLITVRKGLLACTQGNFILSAARWFVDGGSRVTVGDSPAFGTAESVLARLGIAEELRRMGVAISNFEQVRQVVLPGGIRAGLAADALDCDFLVNLPRVKAHAQLRFTMAVKNYFGCLAGMRKPLWHMIHGGRPGRFESLIIDLLSALPDGITLVDGIIAMHRTGPVGGNPFPLHTMACSTNPVAADSALLEILGFSPTQSPLLALCRHKGLNGSDIAKLHFPLLAPGDLAVEHFEAPAVLSPIRFSPCRFMTGSIRRMLPRPGEKS